ncbi:hypothetical protein EDC61_11425 [Sulfuritortus calidifontis]|uniref:Uncharacterized protein n=1 Tax=Sulfuritortus calidifontis TaxID=1914471 RepID=A0A4R3JVC8_9PROT|nr:hypothetical protein [Sulfuritortus calidifontis]TCS70698.1 hypothetical protein EDC61_11425 [Sulfuritortus calidifontis]
MMTDDLIDRIATGMSTKTDADVVVLAMARLARYEQALHDIAMHGRAEHAIKAYEAIAGRYLWQDMAAA